MILCISDTAVYNVIPETKGISHEEIVILRYRCKLPVFTNLSPVQAYNSIPTSLL